MSDKETKPRTTGYVVSRNGAFAVQKVAIDHKGRGHEFFWMEDLTYDEAMRLARECDVVSVMGQGEKDSMSDKERAMALLNELFSDQPVKNPSLFELATQSRSLFALILLELRRQRNDVYDHAARELGIARNEAKRHLLMGGYGGATVTNACPRCGSTQPHLHPALQAEGEVSVCPDPFHERVTAQNTPEMIAKLRTRATAGTAPRPARPTYAVIYDVGDVNGPDELYYGFFSSPEEAKKLFGDLSKSYTWGVSLHLAKLVRVVEEGLPGGAWVKVEEERMSANDRWLPLPPPPVVGSGAWPYDGEAVLVMRDPWPGAKGGRAETCNEHNTYVAAWWADEDKPGRWVCYMDQIQDPDCPIEPTHYRPMPPTPTQEEQRDAQP